MDGGGAIGGGRGGGGGGRGGGEPAEMRHQREMIKVHGLWQKEKKRVEVLEQELSETRDRHRCSLKALSRLY